jgi:predicted TIM-barrel fold metal-dependent hydrolase
VLLSRRDILAGAGGIAGAATLARPIATVLAAAAQPGTPVNFDMPPGACDCHTHIIGDPRRFPFDASRSYTPESASIAEMRSLHRALHTERVVVVQPTFYGADNSCTLDAIKQIGPSARGVAVITGDTSNAEMDRLHRGGIRGIRIHMEVASSSDAALVRQVFQSAA